MHHKHWPKVIRHFKKVDRVMAGLVGSIERPKINLHSDYFRALVEAIIFQQLSDKAATTIINRFIALFPKQKFPSPSRVLKTLPSKLRTAGISGAKTKYIKGLAKACEGGKINFGILSNLPDSEIITELIKLKGIGQWTAEMFLIFSLGREDVFSAGDLGLKNAMIKLYKLRTDPAPKKLYAIAKRWQPFRSYACLYLWASLQK